MSGDLSMDEFLDGFALWEEHRPQTGEDWLAVAERCAADPTYDISKSHVLLQAAVLAVRQRDAASTPLDGGAGTTWGLGTAGGLWPAVQSWEVTMERMGDSERDMERIEEMVDRPSSAGEDERPLLLAEAPGRGVKRPFRPLNGRGGSVLADCARLQRGELLDSFNVRNLLGRWPGPMGKGSAWDRAAAQRAARRRPLLGTTVILGRRVLDAYASTTCPWLKGVGWGEWRVGPRGQRVVALPHPSGINQLYNDPEMRALVGRVLREALSDGTS